MLPVFAGRVRLTAVQPGEVMKLTKAPLQYFTKSCRDTVLGDNTPALRCGYAFFRADNMLFATEYPRPGGPQKADIAVGEVIKSVDLKSTTPAEKGKTFSGNAK